MTNGVISEQNEYEETKAIPSTKKKTSQFCDWIVGHRLRALLVKNFIRMWRNLGFLTFQFIIPTVQVTLFCLAIGLLKIVDIFSIKKTIFFSCAFIYKTDGCIHFLGRDPTGLTMAVVNGENSDQCQYYTDGNYLIIPIPYNF